MNGNEIMRREARVLAALAGTSVPHPRLIAGCESDDVIGAAFYLMEPVEGFNVTVEMPPFHASDPTIRRAMGMALVDGAAALADVNYVEVGLGDFGKPDGFLERQVNRWRGQLESYREYKTWPGPDDLQGVEKIGTWLSDNRPRSFRPGILHGDYHLGNVMFRLESPELAAIVDWELATIGDPLLDLGWIIATWPEADGTRPGSPVVISPWTGFPQVDALVARYRDRTGRDLSALNWYVALACYKLAIILEGTYARATDGKAPIDIGNRLHWTSIGLVRRGLNFISK
jgi:aminoglycoside phosphotransferase (APT) family kinase protein